MAVFGLFMVGLLSVLSSVHGSGGGWINAHATFYGGNDASGTMGMHFFLILRVFGYVIYISGPSFANPFTSVRHK